MIPASTLFRAAYDDAWVHEPATEAAPARPVDGTRRPSLVVLSNRLSRAFAAASLQPASGSR